jgi:hypothetical protein
MINIPLEHKRIEIAKYCGWEWHYTQAGGCYVSPDKKRTVRRWQDLPDYFGSLDAMHEAESCLNRKEFETYYWIVWRVVCNTSDVLDWNRAFLSATASQRAEAFFKTISQLNA